MCTVASTVGWLAPTRGRQLGHHAVARLTQVGVQSLLEGAQVGKRQLADATLVTQGA